MNEQFDTNKVLFDTSDEDAELIELDKSHSTDLPNIYSSISINQQCPTDNLSSAAVQEISSTSDLEYLAITSINTTEEHQNVGLLEQNMVGLKQNRNKLFFFF